MGYHHPRLQKNGITRWNRACGICLVRPLPTYVSQWAVSFFVCALLALILSSLCRLSSSSIHQTLCPFLNFFLQCAARGLGVPAGFDGLVGFDILADFDVLSVFDISFLETPLRLWYPLCSSYHCFFGNTWVTMYLLGPCASGPLWLNPSIFEGT